MMRPRVFKALHSITLGLMVLLAGASNCFSQSYDPDPWDDTPPVTVEFNYLLPQVVSLEQSCHRAVQTHFVTPAPDQLRVIPHPLSSNSRSPVLCEQESSQVCPLSLRL
jgi:hypothetical protein